jgi:hypothetical protein
MNPTERAVRHAQKNQQTERNGQLEERPGSSDDAPARLAPDTILASDLMALNLPDPRWAVESILPEGLAILAGKPKQGKSWLALCLALAIALGGIALGKIPVEAGEVLYLALEDNRRRLQSRLAKMLNGTPAPECLHFATEYPRMGDGAEKQLATWLDAHPEARLVIIDTLARIRPPARDKREDAYARDYATIQALQAIVRDRRVALLVVHHQRKMESEDPFDTISGTLGLSGAADTLLILKRRPNDEIATLHLKGRDVEEKELALRFDPQYGLWQIQGDALEVRQTRERKAVIDLLERRGPLFPAQITDWLDEKPATIRKRLRRMFEDNQLNQDEKGRYCVPPLACDTSNVTPVTLSHPAKNPGKTPRNGKCDAVTPVTANTVTPALTDEERRLVAWFLAAYPQLPLTPFAIRPGERVTDVPRFYASLRQRISALDEPERRISHDDLFDTLRAIKNCFAPVRDSA